MMYHVRSGRGMGATCALTDLACLQAATGVTASNPAAGVCLAGDAACLATVAATLAPPLTDPPAADCTDSPFCGACSNQWIQGLDNCALLLYAAGAVVGLVVLASLKGGRR